MTTTSTNTNTTDPNAELALPWRDLWNGDLNPRT